MSQDVYRNSRGFSLLELLVAMAIFAGLAVVAQRGMLASMLSADRLSQRGTEVAALQLAVSQVTQDIRNAVPRPIRTGGAAPGPALLLGQGGQVLTFTRAAVHDPTGRARSPFQRVIYAPSDDAEDRPQRGIWTHVDQPDGRAPRMSALDAVVTGVRFEVLSDGAWQTAWPPAQQTDPAALPEGIAVTFDTARWGAVRRVVALQ
ncbi:MAG: type II secretion system minor pseudopilin GspJ [Pseudomonadota bacterium]